MSFETKYIISGAVCWRRKKQFHIFAQTCTAQTLIALKITKKHNFPAHLGSSCFVALPGRSYLPFSDVYFKNFARITFMSIMCVCDSTDKRVHARGKSQSSVQTLRLLFCNTRVFASPDILCNIYSIATIYLCMSH